MQIVSVLEDFAAAQLRLALALDTVLMVNFQVPDAQQILTVDLLKLAWVVFAVQLPEMNGNARYHFTYF